ncbi:MAG TPA: outer membrane beta-barrel protein [Terriglobia bacterium]|nr:outer membrane beta-barrel protein [Terriglobia bacterium]
MRNAYWFIAALLLMPLPVAAQNTPAVEVFGGYSHLMGNLGNSTVNLNGFDGSVTENLNRWFGGTLDISSQFGTEAGYKVNSQTITYGPMIAYRKNPKIVPFAHGLLGAVRGSPEYLGISKSEYRFAMLGGGGVDVRLSSRVSLRLVQFDYLFSHFSMMRQDNIRISAGFVFRFGQK